MVLSNKKLKQKLRAQLAESLMSSLSNSEVPNSTNPDPSKSLKELLDSATQKPRLSKREKRRKSLSLENPDGENARNDESGDAHVVGREKEEEGEKGKRRKREKKGSNGELGGLNDVVESFEEKKKKKKEKKKEELGLKENGDVKKEAKGSPKKNKKKKNKNKDKNKKQQAKEGDHNKQAEGEGEGGQQDVAGKIDVSKSQESEELVKRVYVGGIPYYSTEDDIRSYFDHCGTITDVDCMKFPETGKFRGIAIISFKTEEAAKRALALDGSDMGGLYLKIQPYKTTRPTKTSDFSPQAVEGYNRVYVGNLSWDITEDDLRKLFSECRISSIRFGEDKETGEFKGYAHVDFSDHSSLTNALKLDQKIMCGRPVRISCAVSKGRDNVPLRSSVDAKLTVGDAKVTVGDVKTDVSGVSSGKMRRRTCYECGEKGHISSACPKKQAEEPVNGTMS